MVGWQGGVEMANAAAVRILLECILVTVCDLLCRIINST